MSKSPGFLVNPAEIAASDETKDGRPLVRVVIETPRGGRNKLSYDEDLGIFRIKKVLPEGMSFPYDFGFVPSTLAEDGDPLDALVLMDDSGCTGCLVEARPIGVIAGESKKKGEKWTRNDRLVVVAQPSHTHGDLKHIDDLNASFRSELEKFFVNYHASDDEKFRVIDVGGPKKAWKQIERAMKSFDKR